MLSVLYRLCQHPLHIKYIHPFLKFIKCFFHFKWVSAFAVIFSFCYTSWLHQWFIWRWILVLKFSPKSQHNFLKHKFDHVSSVLEPFSVSHGLQKSTRSRRKKKKKSQANFIHTAIHMLKGTFTHNKIGMTPLETGNTTTLTRKSSDLLPYKRSKCPRENPQAWLWRGKHMKFEIGKACTWPSFYI